MQPPAADRENNPLFTCVVHVLLFVVCEVLSFLCFFERSIGIPIIVAFRPLSSTLLPSGKAQSRFQVQEARVLARR